MSMGESSGGLPPDSVCEKEDDVLIEMERLIKDFHDDSKFVMHICPLSTFFCSYFLAGMTLREHMRKTLM